MLQIDIVTPDRKVFSGEASSLMVPGTNGSFEILPRHAAIVSTLEKGKIRIRTADGNIHWFQTAGGVIEVLNDKVSVLLEKAESLAS